MKREAFSCYHPAVNFLFFIGALGFGMVIQHPAFVAAGILAAACYLLLLKGSAGWKLIGSLLPLLLVVILINPLFNANGQTPLFSLWGKPYTLEALCYGAILSGVFLTILLWFSCYNEVMTGDKFTSLFGNLAPSLSLLLVMVLRMVPNLLRKGRQITGTRQSIGKGISEAAGYTDKARGGMLLLGCLTTWALEGSVTTADSMRSRGYGTTKRSSFMIYRMTGADWTLLTVLLALIGAMAAAVASGAAAATFTPEWYIEPLHILPFGIYCVYLLIPTLLHIKEAITWHILRSKS